MDSWKSLDGNIHTGYCSGSIAEDNEPIHRYFELTYAHYLVLPRTALQSMPLVWQRRFISCMEELDRAIDWKPKAGNYEVSLRGGDGRILSIELDPLNDYQRGRRKITIKQDWRQD